MRERRHNGWVAGWALGCLLVLAFTATSPVRAEATPTPTAAPLATATPTATPTPAPTATPAPTSTPTATPTSTPAPTPTSTAAPTATPTPAPQAACQPWATPYPHDHIVRGEWVDVAFHDFDPGGAVTLLLIASECGRHDADRRGTCALRRQRCRARSGPPVDRHRRRSVAGPERPMYRLHVHARARLCGEDDGR